MSSLTLNRADSGSCDLDPAALFPANQNLTGGAAEFSAG